MIRWLVIFVPIAACRANTEHSACTYDAQVGGTIVEGSELDVGTPVPVPFTIGVAISSGVAINSVLVGNLDPDAGVYTVAARLTDLGNSIWQAQLYPSDLEHFRVAGSLSAEIPVTAFDQCNKPHLVGTSTVALGPPPGQAIEGLSITADPAVSPCFIPNDGSVEVHVAATADRKWVGAPVLVSATNGIFSSGDPTMQLTFADATTSARAQDWFTPTQAGTAVLEATSGGVSSDPYKIVIAGVPTVVATTTTPLRQSTAWLDFTTAGYFASCEAEESVSGTTTVALVGATNDVFTGTKELQPGTCALPEAERISVRFAASSPSGAAVTVRCTEAAYGRIASTTLVVADP